ncbi:hypothetical protein [Promineifilum sp.]|uniref:hypothetical protein n=1 Tax=Promineifilum sp. TaxID=2664178 RepID=UPI0035B1C51E
MKSRVLLIAVLLALVASAGVGLRLATSREATAAPNAPAGFASPINGGCYIAAANVCKIHIDPFTINIDDGAGARLQQFTLYANGNPIYDFRTDVSNPPAADYSPSLVMEDFAAQCGQTYAVNMVAKDTSDANPLNYGQTAQFTCPASAP